jgi:hypothetical protein
MNQPLSTMSWTQGQAGEVPGDNSRHSRWTLVRLLLAAMLTVGALLVATGIAP